MVEASEALLVVDGDTSEHARWREAAEKRRVACVCESSLRGATARLSPRRAAHRAWDWVVVEERLPDGSGTTLISVLEQLPARPTVVVVSAYLDAAICIELLRLAVAAVAKPVSLRQMGELLEHLQLSSRWGWPIDGRGLGYALSQRELEVLQLSVMGLRQREIAKQLGCSEGSVKTLAQRVCIKAGKDSLRDVVAHAIAIMARQIPRPVPSSSGIYSASRA